MPRTGRDLRYALEKSNVWLDEDLETDIADGLSILTDDLNEWWR